MHCAVLQHNRLSPHDIRHSPTHTRQHNESTSQKVGIDPDLAPEYQLGCGRNAAVENKLCVHGACLA